MIDGSAVQKIAELAREGQEIEQLIAVVGDHDMSSQQLHHIPPKQESVPPLLRLSTLQSLVDYLTANRDRLEKEELVLHVDSPTSVSLLGKLTGEARQRFTYARATCDDLVDHFLGTYHDQEAFVIALQSRFVQTEHVAELLRLVQRIKLESGTETEDDGRTQRVAARSGVHLADDVDVPNPVHLRPYRTFREVDQPETPFVLRVRKDMGLGLYEADGGAWRIQAVQSVAAWIGNLAGDIPVLS